MLFCRPIRQNAWIRGVLGDVKPIQELPEFLDQSESSIPPLPSSSWNFFSKKRPISGTRWSKKKEKFTERIRPIICSKSGTVYVWKFRPSWLCGRRGDDERKWGCWGSEKEQSCQGDQNMYLYLLIWICVLLRRNSLAKVTQIKKNAAALTKKTKEKIPRQPAWGRFSKTSSKVLFLRNDIKEILTSFVVLLLSHFLLVKVVIPAARLRRRKSSCCLPYDEEIQDAMNKFYQMWKKL